MNANRVARIGVLAIAIAAATVAADWPVLSCQAISFDDGQFVLDNPLVQNPGWGSAARFFREVLEPSTVKGYYLPLSMTSLMLDAASGGRDGRLLPFHRTSLILHALNAAMIAILLSLLFDSPLPAAAAGLLFGLHPMTVEAVAWVGERKTLLAAFFAIWSLILYVGYARSGRRRYLAGSLAAYVLALLSKPTTAPLPILLVLLDYWPLRRLDRRVWREKAPYFALSALSAAITVISHGRTAVVGLPTSLSPFQVILLVCHNIGFYVRRIVWPAALSSCAPVPARLDLGEPAVLFGVLTVLALATTLYLARRRARAAIVGSLFFLAALLPTLGLVRYSWVNVSDKYAYLPAIGLLLPLTSLLIRLWRKKAGLRPRGARNAGIVAAVVCLAALWAVGTRRQLAVWRDTGSLCRAMIDAAPDEPGLLQHYGWYLAGQGSWAEAGDLFRRAARAAPEWTDPQLGLGVALIQTGHVDDAVRLYKTLLLAHPDLAQARYNLAGALLRQGHAEEAIEQCREAVRAAPQFAPAWVKLTDALLTEHRTDEALAAGREGLASHPTDPDLLNSVGAVLVSQGKLDSAAAEFRSALRARPDHLVARYNLAWVLDTQGRTEEAIREYREILKADPRNGPALTRLQAAIEKRDRRPQ